MLMYLLVPSRIICVLYFGFDYLSFAPTTPARAGQRDREIESIAQEFLQDDGPRVSLCKSLSVIYRLCYSYNKYYF